MMYTPVNVTDDIEQYASSSTATVTAMPVTTNSSTGTSRQNSSNNNSYHNGQQPILMAVAIPDTIRPPKVSYIDDPNSITNIHHSNDIYSTIKSFLRRIAILIIGLLLTYLTFFESLLLILLGYTNYSTMELILGLIWLGATLGMLLGSFIGAYKGQWRFLVPGLVLQYFVNMLAKILISDVPDFAEAGSGFGGGESFSY